MGFSKENKEDPKSDGQRKRHRDGSMSSGPENKRPCPEKAHGDLKEKESKSSRPSNKRPYSEEDHGDQKKQTDGSKSPEPKNQKPCPEKVHGKDLSKGGEKRKREEDGSCGSKKRPKNSGSKAREEEEPRPGPSTAPQTCSGEENCISVNRFTFQRKIGEGAFGKVFLASDNITKKMLAIKIVTKGVSATAEEQLLMEKKILQLTPDNPFLVNSSITFQTKKHWCFAMDYASGGNLRSLLKKQGCFPLSTATFYAAEIASGLQFLHKNGFIHRDLKPANILIADSGHLKIADFGLAVNKVDGVSGRAGTAGYMAPEVITGKKYNAAADWFSFGIILYQMVTGDRSCYRNSSDVPTYYLDSDTENIVKELLCKDPSRRLGINGCIRQHPFFQHIDWKELEALKISPPFIPF
ncbi:protein kinase C delta type-like isoform X1 [Ranitomeya variabilis]|uniref:protein kinase C delta type-like isoform X1 n=1 Tax=Ranitomeya variabilis TaxID=490064 RepID=UPI00405611B1